MLGFFQCAITFRVPEIKGVCSIHELIDNQLKLTKIKSGKL